MTKLDVVTLLFTCAMIYTLLILIFKKIREGEE